MLISIPAPCMFANLSLILERVLYNYIKKDEVRTSTDTPQSSFKVGSSKERPGWFQRLWTRIRLWSKTNAVSFFVFFYFSTLH